MTKDLDIEILELQAEKKRLEEEYNKQQDIEIQLLLKEKEELELVLDKKQEEEIKQLVKEKENLEKEILTEQQKQDKLKKLFELPKFDNVDENVKTKKSVNEEKLLNTLKELTGAVNKFQTDEIVKTNITENDFTKFVAKQQRTSIVSEDLVNNVKKVIETNTQPVRSLQQDQIYENANTDINNKDTILKELTKQAKSITEDIESGETSLDKLTAEFSKFKQLTTLQLQSLGGGGSTKISNMDDVDISGQQNGYALKYNSSTGKYDFGEVASDLSAVDQDIIPDGNGTRNLGSSSKRWGDLFLSGDTINLGGATISSDGTGSIAMSATGVTLPTGSKVGSESIAQADSKTGVVTKSVPFFTNAGGLSSAATTFTMAAGSSNASVFTSFTKANGTQQSKFELFSF